MTRMVSRWRKSDSWEGAPFAISRTSSKAEKRPKEVLRIHDLWPIDHADPATLILWPSTSYLDKILVRLTRRVQKPDSMLFQTKRGFCVLD
jgi:hypothetical protein